MKTCILCLMMIFVAACGSGGGGSSDTESQANPIKTELSGEEKKLVEKLLEFKSMPQKDLLKEILRLGKLENGTLKKLDIYLSISCSESDGLCQIAHKDLQG